MGQNPKPTSRHVSWVDIANKIDRTFGWNECENSLSVIDVFNNPPRDSRTTANDRQQTILLSGILNHLRALVSIADDTRSILSKLPTRLAQQQSAENLKIAKEERKTAEARERTAKIEYDSIFAKPPVMYQCDHKTLSKLSRRIRHKF